MLTRHFTVIAMALAFMAGVFMTLPAHSRECRGEIVTASWYGPGFHGRRTASGEMFDAGKLTAAHRSLPFGTRLRVTYRRASVRVRVSDRGPAKWTGRSLDLSRAAASALGMRRRGVARVCVERVG